MTRPLRVLVATTAGSGHLGPLIPFARACRRAGHEVLVASPASFRAQVERAGFDHWPFADIPEDAWAGVMARLAHNGVNSEESRALILGEVFAGMDARAALPGVMEAIDRWQPDLVLRESCELGSSVAADRRGIPQVRVGVNFGRLDDLARPLFASSLAPLRASVGLDEDADGTRLAASPYLTFTPPLLDDREGPWPAEPLRFRPEEPDASSGGLGDGWWPDDLARRPVVYLSFGTVSGAIPMFGSALPTAVEALRDLDVRLLVTLGDSGSPDRLGPQPPNVHVETWVDEASVLPHVAAAVTHGGYGSVLRMLSAGVPLVVAPMFGDQPDNARSAAGAAAAIALPAGLPDGPSVREAMGVVLADSAYRDAAAAVAADVRRLPPVDEAVPHLERYAGR